MGKNGSLQVLQHSGEVLSLPLDLHHLPPPFAGGTVRSTRHVCTLQQDTVKLLDGQLPLDSYTEIPWHNHTMSCTTIAPLPWNLNDNQDLRITLCSTDRTPGGKLLFLRMHSSLIDYGSRAQICF